MLKFKIEQVTSTTSSHSQECEFVLVHDTTLKRSSSVPVIFDTLWSR